MMLVSRALLLSHKLTKKRELESVRIGKSQNWKLSELGSVRIGKCQNRKVSELESVRIRKSRWERTSLSQLVGRWLILTWESWCMAIKAKSHLQHTRKGSSWSLKFVIFQDRSICRSFEQSKSVNMCKLLYHQVLIKKKPLWHSRWDTDFEAPKFCKGPFVSMFPSYIRSIIICLMIYDTFKWHLFKSMNPPWRHCRRTLVRLEILNRSEFVTVLAIKKEVRVSMCFEGLTVSKSTRPSGKGFKIRSPTFLKWNSLISWFRSSIIVKGPVRIIWSLKIPYRWDKHCLSSNLNIWHVPIEVSYAMICIWLVRDICGVNMNSWRVFDSLFQASLVYEKLLKAKLKRLY